MGYEIYLFLGKKYMRANPSIAVAGQKHRTSLQMPVLKKSSLDLLKEHMLNS